MQEFIKLTLKKKKKKFYLNLNEKKHSNTIVNIGNPETRFSANLE